MAIVRLVQRLPFVFAILVLALSLSGCGKSKQGPDFVSVRGKVTVDGAPVKGLIVGFNPDPAKNTKGPMSIGETNAAGEFTLAGPAGRQGAVVGFHNVTVTCPIVGSTLESTPQQPASPCTLPESYADPVQSGLTAEVKVAGEPLLFELKSKP